MGFVDLKSRVEDLSAWSSIVLSQVAGANIKVLKMDAAPYPEEIHNFPESLLVLEGHLKLIVEQEPITLSAGQMYTVPEGVPHAVAQGSSGTLVIFDAAPPTHISPRLAKSFGA